MLFLIALFPLLGFLANGLWHALFQARPVRSGALIPGLVGSAAIGTSFFASLLLFVRLKGMPVSQREVEDVLFNWVTAGNLSIDIAFRLDPLSSVFLMFITGVATLIHLYSIGYMENDKTPAKFFAYLNLFCFSMIVLVLGSSLPLIFLGWEGVGLCSYLLIAYWYSDLEKASAGKKAFVVNRIGDVGFMIGMFIIFAKFGTLDIAALRALVRQAQEAGAAGADIGMITTVCICLFVGCIGKSAQLPLFVWLPDAMAGPTPVSALIHAATMVTSGVYLVARMNFLYELSSMASHVVAITGLATALFAASIAIAQTDIKKILAYSTISQLGYMFLGCGVGAYAAGVGHVVTHAFFKALLFLGAGNVIHGMHQQQDITKMGGLKTKMPKTFLAFAAGALAISGIPPFSGFFTKDEILWRAYSSPEGSVWFWALALLTSILTAFYMTRLFSLVFLGKPRFQKSTQTPGESFRVHEAPGIMVIPVQILAVLSVIGGFIAIPHLSWLEHWLSPVLGQPHQSAAVAGGSGMEWLLMVVSTAAAALGIFVGLKVYANLPRVDRIKERWDWVTGVLRNKWYVDELYGAVFVRPIYRLSLALWRGFDIAVIDRLVLGFGKATVWTGQTARLIQTGSIQVYAFVILVGILVTAGYLLYGVA
ncbi:MAG: NADH-quinone oxidoreductase subunit L [Bdellovibrionales bacterium RIFOXYC1_FULL_54_43]|nr:MAG: NADH-quinone oxidoreductase subunit L [Bdellovibrionales bacterium RIFOXYC1_FULL_54_43]OFZ78842.1 MAG: NADH-quinone oxidoreductase subunit L [Bdellovibrionales bacterium RIFOXYD1_FULL_55_31]